MTPRRLYEPRRVAVEAGPDGTPRAVGGVAVEAVREEWLVEDRWWAPRPLRRHYFELVLADGRDATVFRDGGSNPSRSSPQPACGRKDDRWREQRA